MDIFAEYYDSMVGADYDKITDFIVSAIKKHKPDSDLICDLGCGTGKVAINLAQNGYDLIGIDSSEDMLIKARENALDNNIDIILFLNQDISDFELYGTVDVIYSTLDTLNYITCKKDLDRLFKLVRNYLNYDGLFIFDVNSEYKFKEILDDKDYIYDTEELFCCWSAKFESKSDKCYHWLTYFEKSSEGNYIRVENEQVQRFYSKQYLKSVFDKYGFEVLSLTDNYSFNRIKPKTERLTYILKIIK